MKCFLSLLLFAAAMLTSTLYGQISPNKLEKDAIRLLKSQSQQEIEKGHELTQQLMVYAKKSNDLQSEINAQLLFARYYDRKGDYRSSIKHSLLIVDKISEFPKLDYEKSLNDFIILLNRFGYYQEALKYERLLLKIGNKSHSEYFPNAHNNMAFTFTKLKMRDSAIYYSTLELKHALKTKDPFDLLAGYNNLGVTYRDLNEPKKASDCFFKADSIFQLNKLWNHRDSTLHAYALGNWGGVLFTLGNATKGEELLLYDIDFNSNTGELEGAINGIVELSKHFTRLKSYNRAIEILERGLTHIDQSNRELPKTKIEIYRYLTKCYQAINSGDKASLYFEMFEQLNDSINQKSIEDRREMEFEFIQSNVSQQLKFEQLEVKQKETELIRAKESERHNRVLMWTIVGGIFCGALIFFSFISKQRKIEKKLAKETIENKDLELKRKQNFLTQIALESSRKKEFSTELTFRIKKLESPHSGEIQSLIQYIHTELNISMSSHSLESELHNIHDSFFLKLDKQYPNLSNKERELCVMIKLALANKEIAVLKGISSDSVKVAKNRLKKKMNLNKDQQLSKTISQL